MRRIDVIFITLLVLISGGLFYLVLKNTGLDALNAGIWSQFILVIGLLLWVSTYLYRVANKKMTYNLQRNQYEESMLEKRLEEMTHEELQNLQSKIDI